MIDIGTDESRTVARRSLAAASANVSWVKAMTPEPVVATKRKSGPPVRVSDEEILAAYHAAPSTRQAAQMAGVGVFWMSARMSRLGLKAKGSGWVRKVTDTDLMAAYHATSTTSEAARAVGLSIGRVSVRLIALGLPSKSGRGRPRKVSP